MGVRGGFAATWLINRTYAVACSAEGLEGLRRSETVFICGAAGYPLGIAPRPHRESPFIVMTFAVGVLPAAERNF